jgi:hypothetical protein
MPDMQKAARPHARQEGENYRYISMPADMSDMPDVFSQRLEETARRHVKRLWEMIMRTGENTKSVSDMSGMSDNLYEYVDFPEFFTWEPARHPARHARRAPTLLG